MKYSLIILWLLTANICWSQNIIYNSTGAVNFKEAQESDKLIFINLRSSGDKPKNYLEESGLNHPEAGSFYGKTFFNYLFDIKDSEADFLMKRFKPKVFPSYYFLDSNGDLIYKDSRLSSNSAKYLAMADIALKRYQAFKTISAYKQKFETGTINKIELKDYISLKIAIDSFDNAELIERYADFITDEELTDVETVLFILKAGPLVGGKAYKKAFKNKEVKSEAYKQSIGLSTRMRVNTLAYASKNKDVSLAKKLAGFYQYNYNKIDYPTEPYSPQILMEYYRNVKDTANYLEEIVKYYDKSLNISPDSAKKYDEISKQKYSSYIEKRNEKQTENTLTGVKEILKPNFQNYPVNIYARRLNDGASLIYNLKTYDPKYFYKGISWSRKANELAPQLYLPKNILAKLLYRAGFYDEAEKTQIDAITTAEKNRNNNNLERLKNELQFIRNRNLE